MNRHVHLIFLYISNLSFRSIHPITRQCSSAVKITPLKCQLLKKTQLQGTTAATACDIFFQHSEQKDETNCRGRPKNINNPNQLKLQALPDEGKKNIHDISDFGSQLHISAHAKVTHFYTREQENMHALITLYIWKTVLMSSFSSIQ